MTTFMAKKEEVKRDWYIIDATDKPLGRLAAKVATVIRGKHKPIYTPHVDTGDYVIVLNAEKVALTGRKLDDKYYYYHTNHPGGIKSESYRSLLARKPEKAIYRAVKGMIPNTPLGRRMLKKLKVYRGDQHPHKAQQPSKLDLD